MNPRFSLLIMLMVTTTFFAQEEQESTTPDPLDKRHELRIDALEGLLVPAIDLNYEYIISRRSGFGGAVYLALTEISGDYQQWAIAPYYRQYFFTKEEYGGKGFFAEGLLQLAGGEYETLSYIGGIEQPIYGEDPWTKFGIGVSFGQKWVNKNGFVVELSLGGGRYFGNDGGPEAFFRGGALVGYRF